MLIFFPKWKLVVDYQSVNGGIHQWALHHTHPTIPNHEVPPVSLHVSSLPIPSPVYEMRQLLAFFTGRCYFMYQY